MSTFDEDWIENDYNPFILFNDKGKILSLNTEAQYLLGTIDVKTIYELALSYSNPTFGFKTTFMDLEFGRFKFFGIMIGYENEEEIGIRLYQIPTFKFEEPTADADLINIYTLIDLCISTNSIGSNIEYSKELDPTIPDVRINADSFIKLLNKIYTAMPDNNSVNTKLYFRVGEHVIFNEKKYSLFSIEISAENFNEKSHSEIEFFAQKNAFYCEIKKRQVTINIPMITK